MLNNEEILPVARQYFKKGADETEVTLNAYCDSVRAVIAVHCEPLIQAMQGILANCAVESGVCMCGEDMRTHSDPMSCGHSPVDSGAHHAASLLEDVNKFLGETKNENAT